MKNIQKNCLKFKFITVIALAVLFLVQTAFCAVADGDVPSFDPTKDVPRNESDALQQMNRLKKELDKSLLQENMQKGLEDYDKKSIDDDEVEKARKSKGTDLKFDIKEIQFTESLVLSKKELDKVSAAYIGRKVTLDELYKLVDDVNELYRKKGYAVCRAFFPEQTIKGGVAKVTLVEGKTGNVKLDNLRFTRKGYVLSRMGLTKGKVNNLRELNRRVSLFNATNDAQVGVKLAAGEEQGTTDYVLTLNEPNRNTVYLLSDNSGSDSTGVWRFGAGWTINSLLGIRDSLSFSYMRTDTSKSGGVTLSVPISKVGTRLSASIYGNVMDMTGFDPNFQRMDPHGDSVSYKVDLTQPFCVTPQFRMVGDFFWYMQFSDSKFLQTEGLWIPWKDDTTTKWGGSIAFSHYGRGVVWYHSYMVTKAELEKGDWYNADERYVNYWLWNFNFVRQQAFMNGNSLTIKLNAQYSQDTEAGLYNSSDAFYLGGVGSIRGYKESVIGGDHGFSLNVEYAMPFRKYRNLTPILFFDYGRTYGPNSFEQNKLASTGFGLRWGNKDNSLSATMWLGIPLVKDLGSAEVDGARLHLSLYAQCGDWLQKVFKHNPELDQKKQEEEKPEPIQEVQPESEDLPLEEEIFFDKESEYK